MLVLKLRLGLRSGIASLLVLFGGGSAGENVKWSRPLPVSQVFRRTLGIIIWRKSTL